MNGTTVLISGASIAGPSLAYWLARYGCSVTVVEKAPALRPGGQAVDFKGDIHRTVLQRMGILDEVRRRQTGGLDQYLVDSTGRTRSVIPGEFTGGEIEIHRGDLAQLLYERTKDQAEYIFGDSITSLTETATGVHVTFERTAPRTFDLVVGADGMHSNVRRLAFGPESDYVTHLGHYYALSDIGWSGRAEMYNEPNRMVAVGGPKAGTFFVFASEQLSYDRYDPEQQKKIVMDAYRGAGWRTDEVIAMIPGARDFYLDSIGRVHMDHYFKGRIVLLGDSAYGNTLAGFGTGLALVGAYVLAGELLTAGGDHRVAFQAYQEAFHTYASINRKANAGPFLAPPSKWRIRMRDWMFNSKLMLELMLKMTDNFASRIELKDYAA
ncbi:FAD-dependent monooxygenase [Actinocrispum sp. NPDC049592]|uniref:FAD-dependent monooxygenase n=1 Tax=Actinocrispum sp. NPDC049592 TaxID=3154835 RepID=UPI003416471D